MSTTGRLPYILRPEQFGGIVFDPFDGTMLELDHEAYAVAKDVLHGRGFYWNKEKRQFATELKSALHWQRNRYAKEIAVYEEATATPTPTLRAPTLVDFQITDQCNMGCPHCYASAVRNGKHVPWEDIQMVIHQLHEVGVCQLAIGGGEPLLHPHFIDLLKLCHEKDIVPNITTGGNEFTDENLAALNRYCGAVGLSLEGVGERYDRWRHFGFENFKQSIAQMKAADIPTVLQITLSAANFFELDEMVDFCLSNEHLYGVIFLAYKNVGRGTKAAEGLGTLPAEQVTAGLKRAFERLSPAMRVGYDCCMTPGIAGVEAANSFIDESNLEGCSATRGSIGISTSLEVIPCTFTWEYPLGNLKQFHVRDIWSGRAAESFRSRIEQKRTSNSACSGCSKNAACRGGCPVMPLINCHQDHLQSYPFSH